jgi:hypothetical protein
MTNDELTERARAFYAARAISEGWDSTYSESIATLVADFAALEREAAVREFIQIVRRDVVPSDLYDETFSAMFRTMFPGKEIGGGE